MRSKLTLTFLLLFAASLSAQSQSLYNLQYKLPGDSTTYDAFLVRYNNGSGLLRVRYPLASSGQGIIAEMDIDEKYVTDTDGIEDTTTLLLTAANTRIIFGDTTTQYSSPLFLFGFNSASGYFEPTGVCLSATNPVVVPGSQFQARTMEQTHLTNSFVSKFFKPSEEMYKNLLKGRSRGTFPLVGDEKKIKLHLLIVADVDNSTIGPSCDLDMKQAAATFDSLTRFMGLQLVSKMISGKTYSKTNLETAITDLKPSPNDIVVFYYTGHGFRIPESPRRFPNLKLKNFRNDRKDFKDSASWIQKDRQDNITYSLNIEDIYNSIKAKGARFSLVVSDCCNDDIFSANISNASKPGRTRGVLTYSENNVRTLFLNKTRTSILATAAKAGQRATSKNEFGGFFSYYFKTTMELFASNLKTNVSWDQVFQEANRQTIFKANHTYCDVTKPLTPEKICHQEPDYQILIEK